jgi:2-oxo-3-hexenedioate decarboxylase
MDPRVMIATQVQLDLWHSALASGARRIGWKLGFNTPAAQEEAGIDTPVIGFLTSATSVPYGSHVPLDGTTKPMVEPEVAIEVGEMGDAIALAAAIEVVDVDAPFSDLEAVVAANIFHRGVLLGDFRPNYPPPRKAAVLVDGQVRETTEVEDFDANEIISFVSRELAEVGETVLPGDKIIAGSLTPPVEVSPGDRVGVQMDNLGMIQLFFRP